MSTSFDVYPTIQEDILFEDLVSLSTAYLHKYLDSMSIECRPDIRFEVRKNVNNKIVHADMNALVHFTEDEHAWFYIDGIIGGTDVYFWEVEDSEFGELTEAIDRFSASKKEYWAKVFEKAMRCGYTWHVNQGAGQPCVISLMYGVIAASLAKLTEGFLYSGDCAWDYQRFPADADDFLDWYFVPGKAFDVDFRNWAEKCIIEIPKELHAF